MVKDEQLQQTVYEFVARCREVSEDLEFTLNTNGDRRPFVAEWSFPLGAFRVRLVCGQKAAVVRVFADRLTPYAAHSLSEALRMASVVGAAFLGRQCGGTRAEFEAAQQRDEPLATWSGSW